MMEMIPLHEAASQFESLLARVREKGDRFVLTDGEQAVAELGPSADSAGTFHDLQREIADYGADPEFAEALDEVSRMGLDSSIDDPWDL